MIPHWTVIQQIAKQYGSREDDFDVSAGRLRLVRKGEIPLVSLEDNLDRVHKRLVREGKPFKVAVERINGFVNFQEKYVLDRLSVMAQAVCRILKRGRPVGTGFLVAEGIVLTNHHVIQHPEDAADMIAEFDYELDIDQVPKDSACFKCRPGDFFLTSPLEPDVNQPGSGLDFTFIAVEKTGTKGEPITRYPPVYLDGNLGKIIKGEACVVIQHPAGLPKKIVLKDIAFFSETDVSIIYESDTMPGSSGSMVVGLGTCEIIALHHAGLPRTDAANRILTKSGELATAATPDEEIDWLGNVGIKISQVLHVLAGAALPPHMDEARRTLLRKTRRVAQQLDDPGSRASPPDLAVIVPQSLPPAGNRTPSTTPSDKANLMMDSANANAPVGFLITALYKPGTIDLIEKALSDRYQRPVRIHLLMPGTAAGGEVELFEFRVPFAGDVHEEAQQLIRIPEILNAEADVPLGINAEPGAVNRAAAGLRATESSRSGEAEDEQAGEEGAFLVDYALSPFVTGKPVAEVRRWNWAATAFDRALLDPGAPPPSPQQEGVRVVQFDTGYTDHPKVKGGFDLDFDFTFLDAADRTDARDPQTRGPGKFPGHGTRTGSILIGRDRTLLADDGNQGLLTPGRLKLVPYRVAETVILINRQQQVAAALDRAIVEGFDVITMSLGLPPTIATATMAKKAYDKGVIWCCAAGNVVQAVVSPAVFPGTIAVAASNPMKRDWPQSSRGDAVDITAPGQHVYVPTVDASGRETFGYGNGTSYAVPHVAAAAAYWLAKYRGALDSPAYAGWRRVEAFRQALRRSASTNHFLPRQGFGAGMLDAHKLLDTPPDAAGLKYAYNDWNEHAFFASLQGYGEMLKTYWNRIHGAIFGARGGGAESLAPLALTLSPAARELESRLFPQAMAASESIGSTDATTTFRRYQIIQSIVETSAH